jgi:hypothetical protein
MVSRGIRTESRRTQRHAHGIGTGDANGLGEDVVEQFIR